MFFHKQAVKAQKRQKSFSTVPSRKEGREKVVFEFWKVGRAQSLDRWRWGWRGGHYKDRWWHEEKHAGGWDVQGKTWVAGAQGSSSRVARDKVEKHVATRAEGTWGTGLWRKAGRQWRMQRHRRLCKERTVRWKQCLGGSNSWKGLCGQAGPARRLQPSFV